jgi:hypothetical protein
MRSLVVVTALFVSALVFAPRPAAAGGVHVSIGIPLPIPVVPVTPVVPYAYYGPAYVPAVPYGYYAPYGGHRHHAHCGHGHGYHGRPGHGYGHYRGYRDSYRGASYGHYGRHPGIRGYTLR